MALKNRCTIDSRVMDQYIYNGNMDGGAQLMKAMREFRANQPQHDLSVLRRNRYEMQEDEAEEPKKSKRTKRQVESESE